MDTLETKRLEMFVRVHGFGSQRATQFPANSHGGELFTRLGTIIDELEAHALRQSTGRSSARESTSSKAAARDELWRRLEAISRTARVIAFTSPGLEDKFRATRGISDQALIQLARAFASDAAPLKDEFIKRGLAATFIADLDADREQFEAAAGRRNQGRGAHVAATAAIDDRIERGMKTVRELDALVRNTFAEDPATLAEWLSASHVERPTHRGRQKENGAAAKQKGNGTPESTPTKPSDK
jgi:hypothetical protein